MYYIKQITEMGDFILVIPLQSLCFLTQNVECCMYGIDRFSSLREKGKIRII